jgi:large subunit ribosomal protein L10
MKKEHKAEVVEQIAAQLQGATAVYAVDYRGLTVTQAAELRSNLRDAGTSFRVVKNTLTLRAAEKAGVDPLKPMVEDGPTALAFVVDGDPALAAKVLDTFARRAQVLELKGGVLAGEVLDVEQLRNLARLPTRDQLNAQLAGVVASPLTTLVRGLGALLSGVAIALEQVRAIRETEAPAPAAPAAPEAAAEADAPAATETVSETAEQEGGGSQEEPEPQKEAE